MKVTGSRGSLSSTMPRYLLSEHNVVLPAGKGNTCACVQFFAMFQRPLLGQPAEPLRKKTNFYHMRREICLFLNGFQAGQAEKSHLLLAAAAAGTGAAHLLARMGSSLCWLPRPSCLPWDSFQMCSESHILLLTE